MTSGATCSNNVTSISQAPARVSQCLASREVEPVDAAMGAPGRGHGQSGSLEIETENLLSGCDGVPPTTVLGVGDELEQAAVGVSEVDARAGAASAETLHGPKLDLDTTGVQMRHRFRDRP